MKKSILGGRKISSGRKHGNRILFLAVIFIALVLGNIFESQFKSAFYFVSAPLQKPLWQAAHKIDRFQSVLLNANLAQENEMLRKENQRLWAEFSQLLEMKIENETLRKALGLELQKEFQLLLTQVSSAGISRDTLLLDQGSREGVREGMPVISEQKVLYGFIGQVYDRYSVLYLLSHPESAVNVALVSSDVEGLSFASSSDIIGVNLESRKGFPSTPSEALTSTTELVVGEVRGEGGGAILDLIPRTYDLKKGELILTKSFAGKYPQGLLVGFVGETERNELSPFRRAKVELFSQKLAQKLFIIIDF